MDQIFLSLVWFLWLLLCLEYIRIFELHLQTVVHQRLRHVFSRPNHGIDICILCFLLRCRQENPFEFRRKRTDSYLRHKISILIRSQCCSEKTSIHLILHQHVQDSCTDRGLVPPSTDTWCVCRSKSCIQSTCIENVVEEEIIPFKPLPVVLGLTSQGNVGSNRNVSRSRREDFHF